MGVLEIIVILAIMIGAIAKVIIGAIKYDYDITYKK